MVEPFISHRFPEYSAVFGDVDGDGRPDTVVTNSPWDAFVVLNRGEVHPFVSQLRHDSKEDLVAVNDQNGDGHGDFIYAHDSGGRRVAFGKGDGTIGDSVVTSVPLFISESFDVDFDGDGLIDAVSVGPAAIRLLKGAGDGTFVDAGTRPAPRPLDKRDPLFADFDMHLTDGASYRSVTFDFPTVALNGSMRWATITDFDRDGSNDVVLLNSNSLQVLRNLGNGTFAVSSVPSGGVEGGALVDADRDGWIDFIGRGLSSIHVVRNVCAVPRLKTVSPSAVHEEERATIYVQALGPTDLGGGVIEIAHNGAPVHEEVLLRFTATSWTSPPLAAGLHTFKIRYHTDPGFPIEEVEISVRAVAPGSRRRTVRH